MNNLLIGDFEGPLDLLLHLIKKEKKDIFEIKITEITENYLDYIKLMEDMNLDVASEYLVMAAELVEMKSRSLLPIKEEETEEIDPEEELKNRLIEYEKYKESRQIFETLREKRNQYFTKAPEKFDLYTNKTLTNNGNVSANDLLNALTKLLERRTFNKPITTKITKKELSTKQRTIEIRNILKKEKKVLFSSLFLEFSKPYVIVTFLSLLEMAKNGELNIKQENNFSEIYLERVEE